MTTRINPRTGRRYTVSVKRSQIAKRAARPRLHKKMKLATKNKIRKTALKNIRRGVNRFGRRRR
jgi:hypothetical protein